MNDGQQFLADENAAKDMYHGELGLPSTLINCFRVKCEREIMRMTLGDQQMLGLPIIARGLVVMSQDAAEKFAHLILDVLATERANNAKAMPSKTVN